MNAIVDRIKPTILLALVFGLVIVVWAFATNHPDAGNLGSMYLGIIGGLATNLSQKEKDDDEENS